MCDPNNGYSHIWDIGNSLLLHREVEEAFDRGFVIIVLIKNAKNRRRWQLRVVDKSYLEGSPFADIIQED